MSVPTPPASRPLIRLTLALFVALTLGAAVLWWIHGGERSRASIAAATSTARSAAQALSAGAPPALPDTARIAQLDLAARTLSEPGTALRAIAPDERRLYDLALRARGTGQVQTWQMLPQAGTDAPPFALAAVPVPAGTDVAQLVLVAPVTPATPGTGDIIQVLALTLAPALGVLMLAALTGRGAGGTSGAADGLRALLAAGGTGMALWYGAGAFEVSARLLPVLGAAGLAAFIASGAAGRLWTTLKTHREAYAYVAPAMIGALVLVFFPFFYGLAISFTDTTLFNQGLPFAERFNGIDNYIQILADTDLIRETSQGNTVNYQNFWWTLAVTVLWTLTNVALGVSIGLGLALILNTPGLKGVGIYRVLLVLPWALPNYITALIWKGMFHPQFGVINQALQLFGMEPVSWFDTFWTSFLTGLATNVWLSFPFMMVVSLGALQSLSKDMYEAARLEGASGWRQFWSITLPNLAPALVPSVVLSVVWTFNMFNVIYLVSAGEPAGANEILITQAYRIGFEQYQYGYAAAYSVVIFALLLVYGIYQIRASKTLESVR